MKRREARARFRSALLKSSSVLLQARCTKHAPRSQKAAFIRPSPLCSLSRLSSGPALGTILCVWRSSNTRSAAVDLTNSPSTTSTPITARHSAPTHGHRRALPSPVRGTVTDNNDGSYSTTLTTTIAGKYDMHTYLVIPGGLMGHYFDDAYFSPSHLVKTRVDKTLNFDWGDGRITTHGSDFVSVYWDGRIKVAASESYTFMIEFDDNVRLFIDGVLLVDKWDRAPYTASATVDLVAGTYHEILLEYREIRNDAHLHLFWESPTVAKELVPSTNLFYTEDVNGSPANYTVIASTPDGAKTTAKGLGLHAGTAGQEHKFTIESRDAFGNWRGDFDIGYGGTAAYYDKVLKDSARMDGFAAVATLITDNGGDGKGSDKVPVTIEFNPLTHLFDSTFTPHLSGDYRLDVALTDELLGNYVEDLDTVAAADHIFGSPFSVSVAPALTFALHSDVYGGNGNCPGSAGLYDTTGAYGDTWASWSAASCSGINHGMTGTEQVRAPPHTHPSGPELRRRCDPLCEQPATASRSQASRRAACSHRLLPCSRMCVGVWACGRVGVWAPLSNTPPQYFYINSRDVHHNNRHAHGDSWEVVAHSLDGKIAFEGTAVPTATAGEYIAKVTPETEGQYYLDVTLDGVHAKGSPFKLYVRHNDAASNSYIIDAASLAYATTSGHPTNNIFYVQLVDANDNKLQSHSTPYTTSVSATITSDAANAVVDETAAIQMMGDGTVKVTHTPTTIGANKLNIVVNGAHIKGSPFEINVLPGAVVGATGTATGGGLSASVAGQVAEFIVQSRDLESNPRDSSTDSYTVLLTMASLAARPANYDTMVDNSWGSTASVTGVVEYIGNGQYKCTYNATVAGTYDLDVQIGGTHIVGSPFSPVIAPTVASGTESDVHGTGTRTGTAGATALVEVYLRDVFENYLLAAGDLVKCVAELTSTHQVAWQEVAGGGSYIVNGVAAADLIGEVENVYKVDIAPVSLGNSQYSCDYVPAYSGDYAVKAFLETPGGLFGSYYRTDNFAPSKLSLVRHDLEIDFDWGQYSAVAGVSDPGIVCSGSTGLPDDPLTPAFDESKCAGNGLAMPLDHFSVVWEGFVEAEHDEEYEIGVVCDSNSDVGVWVGGIEVVSYGPCGGAEQGEKSGKVLMQAGVRASIEVKYSHATRESSIGLRWTSPSQGPWGTIGKDRLFRDIQIDPASTYEPAYAPSAAASAFSTVIGPAAYEAVAGVTQTFVVECRDAFGGGVYGNLQLAGGGCQVAAVGRGASGNAAEAAFEGAVTDNGDGTYTVTYQPEHSGSYYLSVTAVVAGDDVDVGWYHYDLSTASSHVVGSPFILQVEPGEVVALESHVDVEVVDDAIVGQESQVVVWSRDVWANRRLVGGNSFEVFLAESGVGDTFGHVDGDKNVYAAVVDNGDGTYTASFTPGAQSEVTGDWELRVFLTTAGSGREECKGSPYGLVVWPNTPVASESYIKSGESSKVKRGELEGGGSREELIEFAASTGSLRTWYVQAADVSKNDWWIGGSSFVARVRGEQDESDENKRLAVVDVGDGRYRVDMTLEVAGDYEIDIGLAGEAGKVGKAGGGVEQVSGGGGLLGRYFNNQHLKGTPEFERVDKVVDFSWGHGYVTNSAVDFVSVEWTGWIKCPNSEEVVFELANVDDYARLYIEDVLVVDTSTGVGAGGWVAKEGMLYKVRVEFFETQGEAGVGLYWSSMSMQRHIVPSVWLFSYLEAIQGSPFKLTVA